MSRVFDIAKILWGGLVASSVLLLACGYIARDEIIMFWGVFTLFSANIIYAFLNIKSRILYLLLHVGIFLFLLTRPFIGLFFGNNSWMSPMFGTTSFALGSIYLSMACLTLGTALYDLFAKREWSSPLGVPSLIGRVERLRTPHASNTTKKKRSFFKPFGHDNDLWTASLALVSLCMFLVTIGAEFVHGYQTWSYMRGLSYESYFLIDSSAYSSGLVTSLASMCGPAMCIYLATMPKKMPSVAVLMLNLLSTIPFLMIGSRTNFVLALVFMGAYFAIREVRDGKGSWIGRKEIIAVVIGVPLLVLGMGMLNYIRKGSSLGPTDVFVQFGDSLFKQGVSFMVLEYAYNVDPQVQSLGFKFFTLGSLFNAVTQGFIGQLFLGCQLLPSYNSVDLATQGHWYSHAMSFFAHWNYLGGEGFGSSYILEAFADFGVAGIAVLSFILAIVFAAISAHSGSSMAVGFIALMAARRAFYMPRGEFMECFSWMWSTRCLFVIAVIVACALVLYTCFERFDAKALAIQFAHVPAAPREQREVQPYGMRLSQVGVKKCENSRLALHRKG